jgi:hypothetical protein
VIWRKRKGWQSAASLWKGSLISRSSFDKENLVRLALRTSVPFLLFLSKTMYFIKYKNFPDTKGAKNTKFKKKNEKQKDLLKMRGLNSSYPEFEIEAIEIIQLRKLFGTSEKGRTEESSGI